MPQGLATEFTEQTLRQHLSSHGEFLTGHLNDFRQEFDRGCTEHAWLHVLTTKNFLLTGRVKAVQSAERLRKDLARGMIFSEPSQLLAHAITNYPDTLDGLHHALMDELEIIEDHILDEHHRGERKRLMLARREVAQLHRHMRSQRRALLNAERTVANFPTGLPAVIVRLGNLDQDFEVMEARARFFHDEIDAKLASETNRQLYILSALTAAHLGVGPLRHEFRRPALVRLVVGFLHSARPLPPLLRRRLVVPVECKPEVTTALNPAAVRTI